MCAIITSKSFSEKSSFSKHFMWYAVMEELSVINCWGYEERSGLCEENYDLWKRGTLLQLLRPFCCIPDFTAWLTTLSQLCRLDSIEEDNCKLWICMWKNNVAIYFENPLDNWQSFTSFSFSFSAFSIADMVAG